MPERMERVDSPSSCPPVGAIVKVKFESGWYFGSITSLGGNRINIKYDDGSENWEEFPDPKGEIVVVNVPGKCPPSSQSSLEPPRLEEGSSSNDQDQPMDQPIEEHQQDQGEAPDGWTSCEQSSLESAQPHEDGSSLSENFTPAEQQHEDEAELICGICLCIMANPVRMKCCTQAVCYKCLEDFLELGQAPTCSFCRKRITRNLIKQTKENVDGNLFSRCEKARAREEEQQASGVPTQNAPTNGPRHQALAPGELRAALAAAEARAAAEAARRRAEEEAASRKALAEEHARLEAEARRAAEMKRALERDEKLARELAEAEAEQGGGGGGGVSSGTLPATQGDEELAKRLQRRFDAGKATLSGRRSIRDFMLQGLPSRKSPGPGGGGGNACDPAARPSTASDTKSKDKGSSAVADCGSNKAGSTEDKKGEEGGEEEEEEPQVVMKISPGKAPRLQTVHGGCQDDAVLQEGKTTPSPPGVRQSSGATILTHGRVSGRGKKTHQESLIIAECGVQSENVMLAGEAKGVQGGEVLVVEKSDEEASSPACGKKRTRMVIQSRLGLQTCQRPPSFSEEEASGTEDNFPMTSPTVKPQPSLGKRRRFNTAIQSVASHLTDAGRLCDLSQENELCDLSQRNDDEKGDAEISSSPIANGVDSGFNNNVGPWACRACTYNNANPLGLACAVCQSSRYDGEAVGEEKNRDNSHLMKLEAGKTTNEAWGEVRSRSSSSSSRSTEE